MLILKLLFSMSGKMNRASYILLSFIVGILGTSLSFGLDIAAYSNLEQSTGSSWGIFILSVYSQAAMLTKRIRDTGKSTTIMLVYYASLVIGLPLLLFGLVSQIVLILGIILLGIVALIMIFAVVAGSAQSKKSDLSWSNDLTSNNPEAESIDNGYDNADVDEIIARELEKRRLKQHSAKNDVLRPATMTQNLPGQSTGFGRRNSNAFTSR